MTVTATVGDGYELVGRRASGRALAKRWATIVTKGRSRCNAKQTHDGWQSNAKRLREGGTKRECTIGRREEMLYIRAESVQSACLEDLARPLTTTLRLSHHYFGRRCLGHQARAAVLCASTAPSNLLRNAQPCTVIYPQRASLQSASRPLLDRLLYTLNRVRRRNSGSPCPPDCRDRAPASCLTARYPLLAWHEDPDEYRRSRAVSAFSNGPLQLLTTTQFDCCDVPNRTTCHEGVSIHRLVVLRGHANGCAPMGDVDPAQPRDQRCMLFTRYTCLRRKLVRHPQ